MIGDCKRLNVSYEGSPCYDIVFMDSFKPIREELSKFHLTQRKIAIVTDSNVSQYHAKQLKDALEGVASLIVIYTFPAGEENKNLNTVQGLYEFLISHSFDRKDVLLALGGGVTGDLTGFTAATYLRGIRFFQIPTSLLAMVDSSIGGKTGVDFSAYKNMVGAFYMPCGVYMNFSVLETLPEKEYNSGMGEIIKHGLIKDRNYYEFLIQKKEQIQKRIPDVICDMVKRSCEIKREVVEQDPKEEGVRALLNFGHSIGHAVEKLMNFTLLHGECVSIGMVGAAEISYKKGYLTKEELNSLKDLLLFFSLPIHIDGLKNEDILAAMQKDKKVDAGKIRFILLQSIGDAFITTSLTNQEISDAIRLLQDRS